MNAVDLDREVERYLAKPYRVELIPDPDDGGWVVRIPDLPGCISQGDTVDEAMDMIRDAQRGWVRVSIEEGLPIPDPRPVGSDTDSGELFVRVPKEVHRDLARLANAEGVSLNLLVATILARALGRKDIAARRPGRPRTRPIAAGE